LKRSGFQLAGKVAQAVKAVQLSALAQRARPGKDGRDGVGAGFLTLQVLVIMARYRTVRGLVLELAAWGDEHAGHHGKAAERGRDHIAHHVSVVVFERPDKAALAADDARHRVVDQRIEIFDAGLFKRGPILGFVQLGKDIFKAVVVDFGNGVLGGKP